MPARLVFLSGPREGTAFEVPDREVTIGRAAECTLRFENDNRVVSGRHATLFTRDGLLVIRDNHSMNGTWVDGERVTECTLRHGQTLTIGTAGPTLRVEVPDLPPPTSVASQLPASAAPAAAPQASGLTALYNAARVQAAAKSSGEPSQTAIIKNFVRLAQEQTSRRTRRLTAVVALAALLIVAGVFAFGEWRAMRLRQQLTQVTAELVAEGQARSAVQEQLASLASVAADWQKTASTLAQDLQSSRDEMAQQRRQLDEQRRAVQGDARFGPTVTQRFASGVGLIQVRTGWHNTSAGWLRLRGTSDGKLAFGTAEKDHLALQSVFYCTGFLVDEVGWVMTNRHCLDLNYPDRGASEDAIQLKTSTGTVSFTPAIAAIRISFPPGRTYDGDGGSLVVSREHDVGAFRTATRPAQVPVLPLARGDAQRITPGEDVVMLAFPGGADLTVRRRASWTDSSLLEQIDKAETEAYQNFVRASGTAAYRQSVGKLPDEAEKMEALLKSNVPLRIFISTAGAVEADAMFTALARAGQVQPDVSSRMSVSGVQPTSISYHTLSGVGGASGAPVIGTSLSVVGVNHAGFAHRDRGKQFQQSEAVPIEFAWRFLPRGVAER
jgi:hypothetical protein